MLGCLLGTHAARTVEISNSFEITYAGVVDGVPQVDFGFLTQKQEQCARGRGLRVSSDLTPLGTRRYRAADKKVFPKLDVVGWYSTGSALQEADLELHRAVRWACSVPVPAHASPLPAERGHREPRVRPLQSERLDREGAACDTVRERSARGERGTVAHFRARLVHGGDGRG